MPRKKKPKPAALRRRPIAVHSTRERLILHKATGAKQALERFIEREWRLRTNANQILSHLRPGELLPSPISWKVWLLRDGLVAIRYEDWRTQERTEFLVADTALAEWQTVIPTPKGDVSTPNLRFAPGVVCSLHKITFSDLKATIHNVVVASYLYEDERLPDPEQQALVDFRLTILGRLFELAPAATASSGTYRAESDPRREVVSRLRSMRTEFEELLDGAKREEEVQEFLKHNPVMLGPVSEVIPKQKLGEDFVTDFVLLDTLPQGPEYTLVEIEAASRALFTKRGDPSAHLSHAKRQILDWQAWLEEHRAYLQSKLPGFESPRFLIVIGRDAPMTEQDRKRLRAMNRESGNTTIRTYDDVLRVNQRLESSFRRVLGMP